MKRITRDTVSCRDIFFGNKPITLFSLLRYWQTDDFVVINYVDHFSVEGYIYDLWMEGELIDGIVTGLEHSCVDCDYCIYVSLKNRLNCLHVPRI